MATEKKYTDEMDALKADVQKLRADIAALVGAFGDDASAKGQEAREAAARRLREARAKSEAGLKQIEGSIEQNPLTALAIALGLGFLVGALLNRR
ncbi:hypothetical protein JCM17845_07510 [Iodidimonas gelatinilytica]|uniref:DUF883 domain-containing protein n=1 Tax=Iodidimonas gelatinilytica TaxID=1236966 RepID=A0A5A7MW29_9PROT|nr:DUF883 C-terminal domain-containing protein [Iodidimonas gelatinilytica]GER00128.1 hypothetical protein JCM17845_07510 [Iodidimonas gelatinilytica]